MIHIIRIFNILTSIPTYSLYDFIVLMIPRIYDSRYSYYWFWLILKAFNFYNFVWLFFSSTQLIRLAPLYLVYFKVILTTMVWYCAHLLSSFTSRSLFYFVTLILFYFYFCYIFLLIAIWCRMQSQLWVLFISFLKYHLFQPLFIHLV